MTGLPAEAQFWGGGGGWGNWGGWGRPQPQQRAPQPQHQPFNPFGNFFSPRPPSVPERQAPVDFSHAPDPQKKPDASAANTVVVVGDAMADWLASGLEDTFAENPDFAVLRRHRTTSGLIRYDPRRDVEWPQVIRETIAADKPKFIVMMIGSNDRQQIRERIPTVPGAGARSTAPANPPRLEQAPPADLELQAQQSAEQQNAEREEAPTEAPAAPAASDQRGAQTGAGTFEFHTDKWEAAYIRRIDAAIAALKSARVPVFWVGLPSQRNSRASTDSAYLNELYRQQAEKAGIVYVDAWDGFVDDAGRYSPQGPDFEGQIRRLRSGDGVYFTKPGVRKLAHYVEREILRAMASRAAPVALPLEPAQAAPGTRPGGASRPLAGPVVPLTVSTGAGDELFGSARGERASPADPLAARVLTRGEALAPPSGRADDFSWPRASISSAGVNVPAGVSAPTGAQPSAPVAVKDPAAPGEEPKAPGDPPKAQARAAPRAADIPTSDTTPAPARTPRRARTAPPPADTAPRPPMPIRPFG
jgi:hypothetical protein